MTWKYCEYLDIDKEFQPVFNQEIDKEYKHLWKSFIPHEDFIKFLDTVIRALNRERPEDKKSIWLFGSYGTGKTHAVFVLKHLLEDDDKEVEDYLKKLPRELADKIRALRKQNILVVFKSGAGHVNTSLKLLLEVQQAIYEAYLNYLKRIGSTYVPTKTDIQFLKERLDDSIISWDQLISKHRSKLIEVSSVEDIKDRLDKGDLEFACKLIDILFDEGILPSGSSMNADRLKTWIENLIDQKVVSKILFIWDEFSDFFKSDAPIGTLQELAHLTQKVPFYLLIVTHRAPEHWAQTLREDIGKLKDRFHYVPYRMETITVYKLISQVIRPKNDYWENKTEDIWFLATNHFSFEDEITALLEHEVDVTLEDFKRILPIHPYSAFLASRIVEYFGSTNRTLFKFLKSEEMSAFISFLKEYPTDNYYFLTPDFLWDYFFVYNIDVRELHPEVIHLVNYWDHWREHLDDEDEKRVFKAIMLLFALSEKVGYTKFIKPTLSTLKLAFSGTPVYRKLETILNNLEKKKTVRLLKSREDIEVLRPTHDVDIREIEKIKSTLPDFTKFVRDLGEELIKSEDIHRRAKIFLVSSEDIFKGHLPRISVEDYKIGIVLVLMKKLERFDDLKKKVEDLATKYPNTLFVISRSELGESNWESILENWAYEHYFRNANRYSDAEYHENQVKAIVEQWKSRIRRGEFYAVININLDWELALIKEEYIFQIEGLRKFFEKIVEKIFPYSLDKLIRNDPLWRNKNLNKSAIKAGLNLKIISQRSLEPLRRKFHLEDGILDEEGNFIEAVVQAKKNHPLCKMREEVIKKFETSEVIDLDEVWKTLQKPPFGLYDVPVGCFAFAVLMKEYSKGYFATDDRGTEVEVTPDGMVNYIFETIKGTRRWKLHRLSQEQREFCSVVQRIFKLDKNEAKTPRDAVVTLRNKIKVEYKYPLWTLKYTPDAKLIHGELAEALTLVIDILDTIVKTPIDESKGIETQNELIKQLSKSIECLDDREQTILFEKLEKIAYHEKFKSGFRNFVLEHFFEKLSQKPEDLSLDVIDRKLRVRMQEETCYWSEEKVRNVLSRMVDEFELSTLTSKIMGIEKCYFVDDLKRAVEKSIGEGKVLPLWLYKNHPETYEEVEDIMAKLEELLNIDQPELSDFDLSSLLTSLKLHEDKLTKIFKERDIAIENWITKNLEKEEISEEELDAIRNEVLKKISEKPKISERDLIGIVKSTLKNLRIRLLRKEIREELEEIVGTSDILSFLRERTMPVVLIKYLPEFNKFKTEKRSIDYFFNDLMNVDKLSENDLRTLLKEIKENRSILETLNSPDTSKRALKAFLDKEWIEGVFEESDLIDFIAYLREKLGTEVERWTEKSIRDKFEKWRSEKYRILFYNRLVSYIERLDERSLKSLLMKLLDDPRFGLQVAQLIKEAEKE